jgi:hypothetical protein
MEEKKAGRFTDLAKAQRQLDRLVARGARPRAIRRAESRVGRRALVSIARMGREGVPV